MKKGVKILTITGYITDIVKKYMKILVLMSILILTSCSHPIEDAADENYRLYDSNQENELAEKEYTQEYEPQDTPLIFTTTMRIHEDMPEFTFVRTLGDFVAKPYMSDYERHVSITIFDENGIVIQEIDEIIQDGHGWWAADSDIFELQFDDLNFNGYLDMWLFSALNPGTASGAWAHYWLWDSEIGQFVENEQLRKISDMAWLHVNQDTHQIEVSSRGGGAGPWNTSYYEWIGYEFVAVSSVFREYVHRNFVPSYEVTTYRNYRTGEVSREYDPPDSVPDNTIIKTVDINPYMEFPTHEVRLDMWRLPDGSEYRVGGYQYEIEIIITGNRRNDFGVFQTWQTIKGLRAGYGYGRWIEIDSENPLNLHFADFNGDGYMDMALRRSPPQTGGMADDPHYFWLFNPNSSWRPFERNHSLELVAGLGQIVSVENGNVTIFSFHSVMYQTWETYAYVDGEFVFVSGESTGREYEEDSN